MSEPRLQRQHIRHRLFIFLICVGLAALVYEVYAISVRFGWGWTGFVGGYSQVTMKGTNEDKVYYASRTLWDWMQLLFIPFMLAIVAFLFQRANASTERQIVKQRYEHDLQISLDKQQEDRLQAYLDRIAELLLEKNLAASDSSKEARNVARVRTITVLAQLNAQRASYVFTFLREAGLMSTAPTNSNIVSLKNADLRRTKLSQVNLEGTDLRETNLNEADLSKANLNGANLEGANLKKANLKKANLEKANLEKADLREANLEGAKLDGASLRNTLLGGANLSHVELRYANLSEASLAGATLRRAIFWHANLSEAYLNEANFSTAFLIEANFSKASLNKADLRWADLSGADLSGADLRWAFLQGADLSRTNLNGANVTDEQLKQAKSLQDATMPDGSIHP
jgi:uncharacterized protein YjbI with pentapeptide repeats